MTTTPGEQRHRHAADAPVDADRPPPTPEPPQPQPSTTEGAVRHPDAPTDRPLSRRELREQERRRAGAVPDQRSSAGEAPAVASLSALVARVPTRAARAARAANPRTPAPAGGAVTGPHPHPDHEDLAPHESYRYTWRHLGALAAVAGVLGFLIWSLSTADGSGADGARAADPTTSSSVTTTRGEP